MSMLPDRAAEQRDGAFEQRPSLRVRVWRALGFGGATFPEVCPDDPAYQDTLLTKVEVYLDWRDRLRVLMSGRLVIRTATRTDVPVRQVASASEIGILWPERRR